MEAMPAMRDPICAQCGVHLPDGGKHCFRCKKGKIHFDVVRSFGSFEGPLKELIHKFKYEGKDYLGEDLSFFLLKAWNLYPELKAAEAAVPVPLHGASLRERGYNQAEVLAKHFVLWLQPHPLPCADLLERVRRTETQTRLASRARAKNVESAFTVRDPSAVKGKTILLVDDVCTTCATLNECAITLKGAGARKVFALTLARN